MKTQIQKEAVLDYLKEERKQLSNRLKAIDNALIGLGVSDSTEANASENTSHQNNNTSDAYKQDFTWREKIKYALNKIGSGNVKEITDALKGVDTLTEKVLSRSITQNTSALFINGFLSADESRPRKYKIKSPE